MAQASNRDDSQGLYTEIVDPDRLVREPLVSVVMITYNHEPYIAQAIEGVLSQETDFPIELIIGEDCSTDRTREIVLEYQRRHPGTVRVLFSEKNVGMHKNFRRTALAARGTYMAFCEGDDWWHRRDKLQLQIPFFLADNSLVSLSGRYRTISVQGQVIESERQSDCAQQPIAVHYQDFIFLTVTHLTCTVVSRTDAVRRALLGDTLCRDHSQLLADLPLCIELSQVGRMMQLRETLASYRLTPNSAFRQSDPVWALRVAISLLDIRYQALERYPLPGDATWTASVRANFIRRIILIAAWVGDATVARNQVRRLRSLGIKVRWKEIACVVLALIPLPRRSLTVVYRKTATHLARMGLSLGQYFGSAGFGPPGKE